MWLLRSFCLEKLISLEGIIRVMALCLKTIIELILPSISLVIIMINTPLVSKDDAEIKLTECTMGDWFGNMIKFYLVFVLFFSFGINFAWSFLLNYFNRGNSSVSGFI